MTRSTYYFDWLEAGKRNRRVPNHRILLYGNIFMHAARYAAMKACGCRADCVCTNIPIAQNMPVLHRMLHDYEYSLVVVGEGAESPAPNAAVIAELKRHFPHARFVSATTPGYGLHPDRYRGDETLLAAANEACRRLSAEQGITCVDAEAYVRVSGVLPAENAGTIRRRLAAAYLRSGKPVRALRTLLRGDNSPRSLMRMAEQTAALLDGTSDTPSAPERLRYPRHRLAEPVAAPRCLRVDYRRFEHPHVLPGEQLPLRQYGYVRLLLPHARCHYRT